jgi:ATP-dependent DNA helicase RecG
VLYLAGYIEKYGTGTLMMIRESVEHALPEPDFAQRPGEFVTTLWRDWLTEALMNRLGLDERLRQSVAHLKVHRRITNSDYQQWMGVPRRTATRDLEALVRKGILRMEGKGRGVFYIISEYPPTNAPEMRQMRQANAESQESAPPNNQPTIAPTEKGPVPSRPRNKKGRKDIS